MFTYYLFYTEDGSYLHFEFQTTDKKDDLKRFLFYDASLYYKEKRKVKTVVIYSADIDSTETFIDAGTIKYNIEAVYMKKLKEVFSMTDIGRMIREDGIEKGIEKRNRKKE